MVTMPWILQHFWIILIPPILGAALMFYLRPLLATHRYVSGILCSITIGVAFALSCAATIALAGLPDRRAELHLANWITGYPSTGSNALIHAPWGLLLDPLSSVMILIITGIGFLIHIYSIGYMSHEAGTPRFFGYMNLFVFFMLLLVLANNYLMLFVGWEGVGLCSYLLIGFHFERPAANVASMKAFLTNRLGDIGLLFGIFILWATFGTVQYTRIQVTPETAGAPLLGLMTLLLAFGAAGKSAQFPLFTWLPDAMEGPTPVSALIHAATMVTAGVYLIARSAELYSLTPSVNTVIGIVGAFTAILAASIAIVEHDIKRILAYSTVSQLGYMFMALGAGAYWVAVFHLFTHAFFKALLFLGAGSVIHSLQGEQDIQNMGGLRKRMPLTHATMLVAALAISGFPGLAGFFSKDEILYRLFSSPLGFKSIYVVGLITSFMTAFYMWRLMTRVFYGPPRHQLAEHAHESPASMTAPLAVLALGTLIVGWLGAPASWNLMSETFGLFERWLSPVFPAEHSAAPHEDPMSGWLMILSVLIGLIAMGTAWMLYVRRQLPPKPIGWLYPIVTRQWYIDRVYQDVFVERLTKGLGSLLARFDDRRVDGGVRVTTQAAQVSGRASSIADNRFVDGAVKLVALVAEGLSYPVRLLQAGTVSPYAAIVLAGFAILLVFLAVRR